MARIVTKKKTPAQDVNSLEGLATYAESRGFTKQAAKAREPKLSFFQRLGRGLTAFETGNALYQKRYDNASFLGTYGKDIATGLGEAFTGRKIRPNVKKTFKDIMVAEGMKDRPGKLDAVDVAGFAGDVLTDPTTFFGGFFGRTAIKGAKLAEKTLEKAPVLGKKLIATRVAAENLFQPFAQLERIGSVGKEYVKNYKKFVKGTRALQDDFLGEMGRVIAPAKKIKDAGKQIALAVETGTKTGNKLLDEVMDNLVARQASRTGEELTRGILKNQLEDYMHHMLTPEASDFLNHRGDVSVFLKNIKAKLSAAKERKILGTVPEINKEFKKLHGFDLFEEDAFKAFSKRGLDSIKAVQSYDFLQRVGTQFGQRAEKDFIDDAGIKWIDSGIDELAGVRVPEQIAKHLKEVKTFLSNDESTKGFLRMYDKVQNFWKGTVTGWFPAFHTRNAIGGTFNNWIAGVRNPTLYKTADAIVRGKTGTLKTKSGDLTFDAVRQLMKENGVVGQTGFLDVFDYLQKGVGETALQKFKKSPQRVMGYMEDRMRGTLFIDGLKKGLSPEDAARRVIKFHFDYMPEGFTAFEKSIMRRAIPFYTWTRHNIPLQLEQMIMQPGKYAGVFKAQRAFGLQEGGQDESILPSWLKDRFTVKGEGGYWSGLGLPLEEATEKLSRPLRGFGVSMSPLLKVPIEQLTGYNIFKDRKISEDYFGKQYKNAPEPIKNWLQLKERKSKDGTIYYTLNPRRRYWLEVIGARGLSTGLKLADSVDDTGNIMSLITTIRKYDYTIEDLQKWSDADARKQLEEELLRAGELSQFSKTYVPKSQ